MDKTPISSDTTFSKGELNILNKCRDDFISDDISDNYFAKFVDIDKSINLKTNSLLHWAALAQHYGYPTRLIDITTDPLIALYFAVNNDFNDDGYVYYFAKNGNGNEINKNANIKIEGTYFDIVEITYGDDDLPYSPKENTLNYAKPPYPNERIESQRGLFCWTRKIEIDCNKSGSLPIRIPANLKLKIKEDLEKLNYSYYNIYKK